MPNHGGHVVTDCDDRTLLVQASAGDDLAFEELYRRHADAAWRAANAIVSSADDAADAVAEAFTRLLRMVREGEPQIEHLRAYLLTVTRHAAIDRRRSREDAWDFNGDGFSEPSELVTSSTSPSEAVIDLTDETYVLRAFRELPDRWRQVLWLTEVQGLRPVDAAEQLGMSANAVAQLAFRARAGLRERYMQAHVSEADPGPCTNVSERFGALALGKLSPGERARIEDHLDGCAECRSRIEDLRAFAPERGRSSLALAPLLLIGGAARRIVNRSAIAEEGFAARIGQAVTGKVAAAVAVTTLATTGLVNLPGSPSPSSPLPPRAADATIGVNDAPEPSTVDTGAMTESTATTLPPPNSADTGLAQIASVAVGPEAPTSDPVADGDAPSSVEPPASNVPSGEGPPGRGPDGNGPPGNGPDGNGPPGNGPNGAPGNGPDGDGPPASQGDPVNEPTTDDQAGSDGSCSSSHPGGQKGDGPPPANQGGNGGPPAYANPGGNGDGACSS